MALLESITLISRKSSPCLATSLLAHLVPGNEQSMARITGMTGPLKTGVPREMRLPMRSELTSVNWMRFDSVRRILHPIPLFRSCPRCTLISQWSIGGQMRIWDITAACEPIRQVSLMRTISQDSPKNPKSSLPMSWMKTWLSAVWC